MVGLHSLYSGMPFSLLSFSIPAQLTLFRSLLRPTSATHCYDWVIVLMISATSCWVKWRETLVWVWIKGRHWHKDRLLVQTMENASLNRLWLNRWWLKFHFRQEDNYCFFPEVEVQFRLYSASRVYSFVFWESKPCLAFIFLVIWPFQLYFYICTLLSHT